MEVFPLIITFIRFIAPTLSCEQLWSFLRWICKSASRCSLQNWNVKLFEEAKFSNNCCKQQSDQYHQTSKLIGRKRREKRHFNIPPSIFVSSSADGNASSIPDDAGWEATKAWACFSAILLAVARSMALRLKISLPVVDRLIRRQKSAVHSCAKHWLIITLLYQLSQHLLSLPPSPSPPMSKQSVYMAFQLIFSSLIDI